MTKEYILDFLRENRELLEQKYNVTKIGLFGSYAKNSATQKSDIDIAILTTKKDFFIRDDLREFLESQFHLPVDVGYIDTFRDFYRSKIEKEIIYV